MTDSCQQELTAKSPEPVRILAGALAIALLASCGGGSASRNAPLPSRIEPTGSYAPDAKLYLCPSIRVANAPDADRSRRVKDYAAYIEVNSRVTLATAPVNGACLTSGYGIRNGRAHAGIDLQSRPAGVVFAAGPGRVIEAAFHNSYGFYVLIDHGSGVYTRYAHLDGFGPGIAVGQRVPAGAALGLMGRSGNATAVHLHYEILIGNYDNPEGAFGLSPRDPFSFESAR